MARSDDDVAMTPTPPRRRRTSFIVTGIVVAVVAGVAGVGLWLVLASNGDSKDVAPTTTSSVAASVTAAATSSSAVPATMAVTTVAPTSAAPTTTALPATTTAPSLANGVPDGYVALRSDRVDLRTATDAVAVSTALGCRYALDGTGCMVRADVSATALWWSETTAHRSTLRRKAFDGSAPSTTLTVDGDIVDIAVTPDERTVWFAVSDPTTSSLKLQRLRGGAVSTLADRGADADVSADGRWLAYSVYADPVVADGSSSILVVDLRTGATRAIPFRIAPFTLDHLQWSPDDRHLLFAKSWEGSQVGVLDPATATTGDDTRWIESGQVEGMGCWIDAGAVAVNGWGIPYAEGASTMAPMVRVDVATGGRTEFGGPALGNSLACRAGAVAYTGLLSSEMALRVQPASGPEVARPEYGYLGVLEI